MNAPYHAATASPVARRHAPTLGHVHLRVSDLARSVAFYRDVVGLDVMTTMDDQAAFLASHAYHHHLGLSTWQSAGAAPGPKGRPGLYHTAFLYPDRSSLGAALRRVQDAGVYVYGKADHGVSQAIYFDDPDGNGVELYWDKPRDAWPVHADGTLALVNDPLDLEALLADAAP